jgi:hypothetical protein
MNKNFSRASFALLLFSVLLFACQKDVNETTLTKQVQQDAKIFQQGSPMQLLKGTGVSLGSAVGQSGDLFVPDGTTGSILRIDPKTGDFTTFATGLPPLIPAVGIGGVTDVTFIGGKAYALVTMVDDPNLFPTGQVNGIYRIDGPNSFKIIADIGAFNLANPPTGFTFFISTGVSYSIQPFNGGFLVTDGHLNRVLHVTLDGKISVIKSFGDIVPTGLAVRGNQIFLSQAGPVPHLPENGKVVSFDIFSNNVTTVASGAPLLVDVEFGRGQTLFALSQGPGSGGPDGSPAVPNTGSLVRVEADGTFSVIADELNQPTSLEIIGNTAYIVTLSGDVWTVENIAGPPFGRPH